MSDNTLLDLSRYEGITPGEWMIHTHLPDSISVYGRCDTIDFPVTKIIIECRDLVATDDDGRVWTVEGDKYANARAIADVPKMIAEIRRLRAEVAELQKGRAK